jgi:hypothetical protein
MSAVLNYEKYSGLFVVKEKLRLLLSNHLKILFFSIKREKNDKMRALVEEILIRILG